MIGLKDVEAAAQRIAGQVVETPVVTLPGVEGVRLKLESLQRTGSFKIRGALNAVQSLDAEALARGVSTMSAGNHGLGVAVAARERGAKARIYVPPHAVARKVEAMRAAGAEVVPTPVEKLGEMLAKGGADDGLEFLSPFADARVAAGAGTVGLELARQAPDARSVLVPVGGGGLALGIATAVRAILPHARVWGVTAENSPAVRNAWETGRIEPVRPNTIADGLGAPIADAGVVAALKERLSGLLVVNDDELRAAVRRLALDAKLVAEPAGAAAIAAALKQADAHLLPTPCVAILSGGNVDPRLLADVLGA